MSEAALRAAAMPDEVRDRNDRPTGIPFSAHRPRLRVTGAFGPEVLPFTGPRPAQPRSYVWGRFR